MTATDDVSSRSPSPRQPTNQHSREHHQSQHILHDSDDTSAISIPVSTIRQYLCCRSSPNQQENNALRVRQIRSYENAITTCIYDKQTLWSRFFVSWITPVISLSLLTNLNPEKLPTQPSKMSATSTVDRFRWIWQQYLNKLPFSSDNHNVASSSIVNHCPSDVVIDSTINTQQFLTHPFFSSCPASDQSSAQQQNHHQKNSPQKYPPNGIFILLYAFWDKALLSALGDLFYYMFAFMQPTLIRYLTTYFENYENHDPSATLGLGLSYSFALGISALMSANMIMIRHQSILHWSSQACNALLTALFDKTLTIAPYAMSSTTSTATAAATTTTTTKTTDSSSNDKASTPSPSTSQSSCPSTGTITNLASQDSMQPAIFGIHANQLWSGPFSITMCIFLMYIDFGAITAAILTALMAVFIPYQAIMVAVQRHYRAKTSLITDERIKLTSQLLQGIRVIKLYAWENTLRQRIEKLRKQELHFQRMSLLWVFLSHCFVYVYPLFVTFICLYIYARLYDNFSPEQVFLLLSYLSTIRLPIQFLSLSLRNTVEMSVSSQRITSFLMQEDIPQFQQMHPEQTWSPLQSAPPSPIPQDMPHEEMASTSPIFCENAPVVSISNCDFYWASFAHNPQQIPVLTNISLSVHLQELVCVVSQTGGGSTALLLSILGELYPSPHKSFEFLPNFANPSADSSFSPYDTPDYLDAQSISQMFSFTNQTNTIPSSLLSVTGKIAYCSQNPFLFADSVRNNIILELPFDPVQFADVVEAASLGPDLSILPDGANTIISESGVSLSGGQQARVAFARALYHAKVADIFILDDIFAAVDALVAKTMFFKGVRGILKDKAVILALNSHFDFLQHASRVLYLDDCKDVYWAQLYQYISLTRINYLKHVEECTPKTTPSKSFSSLISTIKNDIFNSSSSQLSHQDTPLLANRSSTDSSLSLELNSPPSAPFCQNDSLSALFSTSPQFTNGLQRPTALPVVFDPSVIKSLVGYRSPTTIVCNDTLQGVLNASCCDFLNAFTFSQSSFDHLLQQQQQQEQASSPVAVALSELSLEPMAQMEAIDAMLAPTPIPLPRQVAIATPSSPQSSQPRETAPSPPPPRNSEADLPLRLYSDYISGSHAALATIVIIFLIVVVSIAAQVGLTFVDIWIVRWGADSSTMNNHIPQHNAHYWLGTTTGIISIVGCLFLFQSCLFLFVAFDTSQFFHSTAVLRVFHATVTYLDVTPMGQLLNRLTKDIQVVDQTLPTNFVYLIQQGLIFCGIIILSLSASWTLCIPLIPLFLLAIHYRYGYYAASVQLKRLESTALSPILTLFNNVFKGNQTIRAYNLQHHFTIQYRQLVDKYSTIKVMGLFCERRFGYQLNTLAAIYILVLSVTVVLLRNWVQPNVGLLAITYSLRLIGLVQMIIRLQAQTSQSLTSIQRLQALNNVPQEPPFETCPEQKHQIKETQPVSIHEQIVAYNNYRYGTFDPTDPQVQNNFQMSFAEKQQLGLYYWPWYGSISFNNVTLRYRPELPIVLNNLNITIASGQSVGLVGRSGAGKSTVLQALFRMIDPSSGSITIDGVNIHDLGIGDLRSRLSIVPQSPTLFSGTIRSNLDPLGRFSDDEMWESLQVTNLTTKIRQLDLGLDSQLDENGSNFSASERQLLCIARALLLQSAHNLSTQDITTPDNISLPLHHAVVSKPALGHILVADEMTSSIPNDDLIQHTIREAFAHCTMLIIAHRLNTVVDLDRILVIRPLSCQDIEQNRSSLVEFGTPFDLLNDKHSEFYAMCQSTGQESFNILYEKAKQAYDITIDKENKKGMPIPAIIRGE